MMAKLAELRELNPDKAEQFVRSTAYLTPSERMQVPRIDGHGIQCSDSAVINAIVRRYCIACTGVERDGLRIIVVYSGREAITSLSPAHPVFPCFE